MAKPKVLKLTPPMKALVDQMVERWMILEFRDEMPKAMVERAVMSEMRRRWAELKRVHESGKGRACLY